MSSALATASSDAPRAADSADAQAQRTLRALVDVLTATLAHARLGDAAAAFLSEAARRLQHDRVALGLLDGTHVRIVALSDAAAPAVGTPLARGLAGAMEEALDQHATVLLPETRSQVHPRITLAHDRLRQLSPGMLATVPIVAAGATVGALLAWRDGGRSFTAPDLSALEQLALHAAPVLHLMDLNERPLHQRAWQRLKDWRECLREPRQRRLRLALIGAGALLALATVLPLEHQLGGPARLEGAVQRVLAAPSDGFIGQVHARPGDLVKAGQVLVELSGQELQLERQRWQSQLAQFENAQAAASARADRTQLAINQSRAAEAEAQLELVESRIARAQVAAPFDGVVIEGDLSQSLGAPVQQGATLMTVAPRDQYRVIVEIDERDIAGLQAGQHGTLALSALPWDTLPLEVTRVTPMASPVQGRNVFEVEARLTAAAGALRPGLTGTAHISAGRRPPLWSWVERPVASLRLALWRWLA